MLRILFTKMCCAYVLCAYVSANILFHPIRPVLGQRLCAQLI